MRRNTPSLSLGEPRDDDELHALIHERTGKSIPRRAVCPHHDAPFTWLADVYFGRTTAALVLAPRGGAKTFCLGLWLWLRCRAVPRLKALVVGAIAQQAEECLGHVKDFVHDDESGDADAESYKTRVTFGNRSELRIVSGSESSVRGPRPCLVGLDEIDDMNSRVLQTALLMASDQNGVVSQNVLVSTKQHAHGNMQNLEDEISSRVAAGDDPPYTFYSYCLLDCMAAVPNCGDGCGCEKVKKGRNEDGSDRTFAQVCGGRLRNADGWITLAEAWRKFRTSDTETFRAEMLCGRASTEGLILPMFTRQSHSVRGFVPSPEIGVTYSSTDFGDANPTAHIYVTFVTASDGATVKNFDHEEVVLPYGSWIVHGEIYKAQTNARAFTDLVKSREKGYAAWSPGFQVRERYYDAQAAAQRREWATHGVALCNWARKDVKYQTRKVRELVEDGRLFIDVSCPNLLNEVESWKYDPKSDGLPYKGTDTQDHAVDALRYAVANVLLRLQPAKTFGVARAAVATARPAAGESPWREVAGVPGSSPYGRGW
jgi:hypothetical protein